MQKTWYLIWAVIIAFAILLRFYAYPARTPFDWDQNRDYQKVSNIISGKPTLLGPIAKGDNGFYLGPLYYYLLVPGYLLMGGHPFSFTATSITIDLLTIGSIIFLAYKRKNQRIMLTITGIIWAFSWFVVENSRISWNVSLLPLWIIAMYAFATATPLSPRNLMAYGLVSSLAWHIHASLLPLSILLPLAFTTTRESILKKYIYLAVGYLIPLLPLLAFDLRHAFFNTRLMLNFASNSSAITPPAFISVITDSIFKLGKNTLALLTGNFAPNLQLGIIVMLLSTYGLFSKRRGVIWASLVVLLNFAFTLLLRDLRYPEYYLAATFIPILVLSVYFVQTIFDQVRFRLGVFIFVLASLIANFISYSNSPLPYSLANKISLVEAVAALNAPVDVRYELSPGREGGLVPLLSLHHVKISESSPTKIVFTDKLEGPVLIGGELATDVLQSGGIKVVKYVQN